MNKPTNKKIYLVPEDGIYCWSTTPAPGAQHESNDAVEYVRGDLYKAMKDERDSLEAQVEALVCTLKNFHPDCFQYLENDFDLGDDVTEVLSKTPQQCLLDVKAEAGRAGYYEGYIDALGDADEIDKEHASYKANEHAAKLRKGGE